MKVLIVEDDHTIRVGLEDNLLAQGWEVTSAANGESGLEKVFSWQPDLIILDIMLPGMNGYEICRSVRLEKITTPILMLTAKGQSDDIVRGLELGADDYLVKPFALNVLLARVKALLRRMTPVEDAYEFGEGYCLDLNSRKVSKKGIEVELTPKEFDLLACFLKYSGRALSREKLISEVWGVGLFVTQRSVDRCVKTLRQKLDQETGQCIRSIRGVGYRWES